MMLLSNKLTYCITTFIFLVAFATLPVMAHNPGADFDANHDGLDNTSGEPLTGPDLGTETDHTHGAAPAVFSITAVDTKGQGAVDGTNMLVSNVDGMTVNLVNNVDAPDADRTIISLDTGDPPTLAAGAFQLKIMFDENVYPAAQATDTAGAAPTIGADTGVFTGVTFLAATKNGVDVSSQFTLGTLTRVQTAGADTTETTDDEYSLREFLVQVTVAQGLTELQLPVSLWVTVDANQVYSLTTIADGKTVQGRGNTAYSTPGANPFSVDGYLAPTIPPSVRETDSPTVTITDPARVLTPGSTANLNFILVFSEAITGLAESDLTITGGTFVSATSADNVKWSVVIDPTGDLANTEVTVTLNDNSVADESGNRYAAPTEGPDTGRYDTVNPTVSSTNGVLNENGTVTLSITFSEELGPDANSFTNEDIDRTNSNVLFSTNPMLAMEPTDNKTVWELTVTPKTPLERGDSVVIVIKESSIADIEGNPLEQDTIVTWTRPGIEMDKPVVTLQDPKGPDSDSDDESPDDDIVIDESGGSITFTISDDGDLAANTAVEMDEVRVSNGTVVSVTANSITINPVIADGANVNTTVTVTVDAGAIADAAGNVNEAVSETYSIGPIFAIPADTILVIAKSAGATHTYLSDQPRLPLDQDPPTPAANIETDIWSNMPDLEVLFSFDAGGNGGTLNLIEANRQDELAQTRDGNKQQKNSVRISEVMWASDLRYRGAQADKEADEQWVEISNDTGAAVRILMYARTGLDSAVNIDDNAEDRVGNAYDGGRGSAGWTVPGNSGNSWTGVNFVSMHRSYVTGDNRGYVNGTSKGHWHASDREYLTSVSVNGEKLYNHVGSPGRPHGIGLPKPSTRAGVTQVPSSPIIINEVANLSDTEYEWIELRNVTGDPVNLRNWMISVVTKVGDADPTDTPLVQFSNNNNATIPAYGVLLLLATDPRYDDDHPIAVGYNVDVGANDQVDGLGLVVIDDADDGSPKIIHDVRSERKPPLQKVFNGEHGNSDWVSTGGMPDSDDFILILRKHDNHEGQRANGHNDKGVAETSRFGENPRDVDKIIDIAGSHRTLDATNYPSTNPADLNVTTLWPLVRFNGDMRPHYGHGDLNHRRHNRLEVNRVRYRQHVKTTAKNDADGGTPGNRAGTGVTHKDEGVGHYAFRDAVYTGLGYKRTARILRQHYGTPGYDGNSVGNTGIVKATAADTSVTISEIMYSTGPDADNPVFPQWVELYNSSNTNAVNLASGWKLVIEMLDADGNPMDNLISLSFKDQGRVKTILPQQTVLVVAGNARQANSDSATGIDVFNDNRVFNVSNDIGVGKFGGDNGTNTRFMFFNPKAFNISIVDKDGKTVDSAGNLDGDDRTSDTNNWELPTGIAADGNRTSIIRVYDDGVARDGMSIAAESIVMPIFGSGDKLRKDADGVDAKWSWIPAVNTEREFKVTIKSTWFGDEDDYGTPNNRPGMVLPVELSHFRPTLEDGVVTIRWTTESELDNAGFNILRSDTREGEYKQVNAELIQGAGTTGERNTYKWVDQTAKPGVVYYYQIEDVSLAGERQALATTKLKGLISAKNKLTTTWSELKASQ